MKIEAVRDSILCPGNNNNVRIIKLFFFALVPFRVCVSKLYVSFCLQGVKISKVRYVGQINNPNLYLLSFRVDAFPALS